MTELASDDATSTGQSGRRRLRLVVGLVVGVLGVLAFLWSAPRGDIPVPGPSASPEQVVRAYVDAINARDFATANVIDARDGSDLGRFSRPGRIDDIGSISVTSEGDRTHVMFEADFSGGDSSTPDGRQWWGYLLEQGGDGRWHIVDAGVA